MRTFRLTRTRGRLTAICEACGRTSGPQCSDSGADHWRRGHQCHPADVKARPKEETDV